MSFGTPVNYIESWDLDSSITAYRDVQVSFGASGHDVRCLTSEASPAGLGERGPTACWRRHCIARSVSVAYSSRPSPTTGDWRRGRLRRLRWSGR